MKFKLGTASIFYLAMEGEECGRSGLPSELESLMREHEEKGLKIQELKKQVEAARLRLQENRKEGIAAARGKKREALEGLEEKLGKLKEEYNVLLMDKPGGANK